MYVVYVQDMAGSPLMPTTRFGKVRRMLRSGQAAAVTTKPFTIRLTYEPETRITQPVTLGIDPGRTNIGLAAVDAAGRCLYSVQCETRNKQIPKLMQDRAAHRRASRHGERLARKRLAKKLGTTTEFLNGRLLPGCDEPVMLKDIINTESRFNNRRRQEGWLTPTATQLLRTHLNLIKRIQRILPVSRIAVELNLFAFMAMDNPGIKRWQYQKGPLHGYGSIREALEVLQDGRCLLCGKRSIEHDHHIVPRSKGGSNTLANQAGLCECCHTLVHTDKAAAEKLAALKAGQNKRYGALSVLNQIIPYLLRELEAQYPEKVYVTTGRDTKVFRDTNNIIKDHDVDAYCIACSTLEKQESMDCPENSFRILQFRRHNRALIHHQTERTYWLDGKKVATNRRKRMDQKTDSLEDWYQAMATSKGTPKADYLRSWLTVKKSRRYYNNPSRLLPGTVFQYKDRCHIMTGQLTNGAYLLADGIRYPSRNCTIVRKPCGLVYA